MGETPSVRAGARRLVDKETHLGWSRVAGIGGLVACLAAVALVMLVGRVAVNGHRLPSDADQRVHTPVGLLAVASRTLGSAENGFWPVRQASSLLARGGGLSTTFTTSGALLRVPSGTLGLSQVAVGRGRRFERTPTLRPSESANEVLYRQGSVVEFFRNGPYGLEQGFTVRKRPRAGSGALVLAVSLSGSLVARQTGAQILFKSASGATELRYGQLSASDATGRQLRARMELRHRKVWLRIDDRNARYPISIDPFVSEPFVQQGEKLTAVGEGGSGAFGASVAISADGNTALIGGALDEGGVGAAWIFTRSGSTWTQDQELVPGNEAGKGEFGTSVALSSNGSFALVGGPGDNAGAGAAWMFSRSGASWTQQGEKLTAGRETESDGFGMNVAVSADGDTALIGDELSALVFARSGSTWTQQSEKLSAGAEGAEAVSEPAVALSADGNTALIGDAAVDLSTGAAWVFTRAGSTWSQHGERLTGSDELERGRFGSSLALSADGSIALVGGRYGAWILTRLNSTWAPSRKLTGGGVTSEPGPFEIGGNVALSSDGSVAIVAEPSGALRAFTRLGATWTQLGQESVVPEDVDVFDVSVALSGDGDTVIAGDPNDDLSAGAAWVFTHPTPTVTTGVASAVTQSAATLSATVDPNGGAVTECWIEYGTTPSYGSRVPCSSGSGAGASPVPVSAAIGGLAANATYHFRAVATNLAGVGYGEDGSFQTPPNPPVVVTGIASSVSSSYATLNATVNPNGGQTSTCRFEYGTSASYGSSVACSPPEQGGESPVAVTSAIPVNANAGYHFRIVAANGGGTSYGSDETFKAPLPPLPRITASMTWRFAWSRRFAIVRSLTVHAVPQGGHVEVSCKGHGCPFTRVRSASVEKHVSCRSKKCPMRRVQGPTFALASLFKGRHLDSGARIAVSIVKPGWVGKSYVFTMRANTEPQYQLGCLAPGSTQPGRGC
jgi:hypothetical protein